LFFPPELFCDGYVNGRVLFVQRRHGVGARRQRACNNARLGVSRPERRQFNAASRQIVVKFSARSNFALPKTPARRSFSALDQALAAAIPGAHDKSCKFRVAGFGGRPISAILAF
jgi:hypothetical protein